MSKYVIAIAVLVAFGLSGSAFATSDVQGAGPINVSLTIGSWCQIWYQDDNWATPPAGPDANEPDIVFSSAGPSYPGDPYRALAGTVIGLYDYIAPFPPTDARAIGFYESEDGATIYMESNANFTGTITCSGDLTGTVLGAKIPTWFTVALTGYDKTLATPANDPRGFVLGNTGGANPPWVDDCIIPNSGGLKGGYGGNGLGVGSGDVAANPAGGIGFGGEDGHPGQDAFQMTGSPYALNMVAPVGPGTMKFLARCKRMGVMDPADIYSATITVAFVTP